MDQFVLPDNQLLGKEQVETEDLPVISQRIQDIIEVLNNFKELGDHERLISYFVNVFYFFTLILNYIDVSFFVNFSEEDLLMSNNLLKIWQYTMDIRSIC